MGDLLQLLRLSIALLILLGLVALILFLLTLQKALKKCIPASRTMVPGKVWLMLIPAFGLFWQFMVIMSAAKSLGNEFARLGIPCSEPAPGQKIGLAMCVCNCCSLIPILGGFIGLVGLVLWIIYWGKIAGYSKLLDTSAAAAFTLPIA